MSSRVLLGVLALNVLFAGAGYCLLYSWLRGRPFVVWLSYAGVALLAGVGTMGVVLSWVAVAGGRTNIFAAVCVGIGIGLAGLGLAGTPLGRSQRTSASETVGWPSTLKGDLVATVSAFGVAVVSGLGLIGGLRTSPWLDDVWTFWVPKGIALDRVGLHADILAGYPNRSYPLWWSIITGLDLQLGGGLDLRAVNFEEAILVVAFVGAVARLLSGRVRPVILWPALLILVASPALFRQAQSGEADLPLACFIGVLTLGACFWLWRRDSLGLLMACISAAAAMSIKNEGLPLSLAVIVILVIFGFWSDAQAALYLTAGGIAAVAAAYPWFHWRGANGAGPPITLSKLLSPHYLSARSSQGHRALQQVVHWSIAPHEWLPIVPLVMLAAVTGVVMQRRVPWILPPLLLSGPAAIIVWLFWSDPNDYVSSGSVAYRVVTSVVLIGAVCLPVAIELLVRAREPLRQRR